MTILSDGAWRQRLPPRHSLQSVSSDLARRWPELPRVTEVSERREGPAQVVHPAGFVGPLSLTTIKYIYFRVV